MRLLAGKKDTPDETICPMWKLNRWVHLIALGVVVNSVVTAVPKDSKTRFTLSSSVFLAQEPNYIGCFLICTCSLVNSNFCRNVLNIFLVIQRRTYTGRVLVNRLMHNLNTENSPALKPLLQVLNVITLLAWAQTNDLGVKTPRNSGIQWQLSHMRLSPQRKACVF